MVLAYDDDVARSNPFGALVRFDITSAWPVVRLDFDTEGDGEPPQTVTFPPVVGSDGRFFKAFAFKPTINSIPGEPWPLRVTATDTQGHTGYARCLPGITVTF